MVLLWSYKDAVTHILEPSDPVAQFQPSQVQIPRHRVGSRRATPSLRGTSISHTCLEHLEAFLCAPLQPQNDQQQCCEQKKPDQLRVVVPSELLLLEPDAKFFEQLLVSDQG